MGVLTESQEAVFSVTCAVPSRSFVGLIDRLKSKIKSFRSRTNTDPRFPSDILNSPISRRRTIPSFVVHRCSSLLAEGLSTYDSDRVREQHAKALADSAVDDFVPYILRHTALTRLGEQAGGDVFVLARIAGHSSITVTQRYVHPQADAIQRVFSSPLQVGTKLGTSRKLLARAQDSEHLLWAANE